MAIKKNDFNSVKKKFSTSAKYKPQRYFDLGKDFLDAVGLPGPAIGHLNMFLGHSDTGNGSCKSGRISSETKYSSRVHYHRTEVEF
jgi:hypothetical protein